MKNKKFVNHSEYDDDYEFDRYNTGNKERNRRPKKNWTKFYQEHQDDYDELEDFHK